MRRRAAPDPTVLLLVVIAVLVVVAIILGEWLKGDAERRVPAEIRGTWRQLDMMRNAPSKQ